MLVILPTFLTAEEVPVNNEQWGIGWQFGTSSTESNNGLDDSDFFFNSGIQIEYRQNEMLSYKFGNFGGDESFLDLFSSLFGDDTEYSFRTTYLTASARTSSSLYVFGGLGVAYINEKITDNDIVISEDNSFNLILEAGAGWDISEHFSTSFAYMLTNAEYADIESLQYTIQYRF